MSINNKPERHDPYAALRLADYRYVLGGLFLISMTHRSLQVAVGWDLYERTGSAMALGWMGVAMFIPVFLLFLPAGQWADRYPRRNLMMISFATACLASLALAYASWTHANEGWIYLAVAANGAAQTISRPARFAIIPSVVPGPLVSSAVAWSTAAGNVAMISGPALSGWMIGAANGAMSVYVMVFIMNVLGFLCVSRIMHRATADTGKGPADLKHMLAGLVHVWKTRVIFAAILLDLVAVLFGGAVALLPIYAKDILLVGPIGLGWLAAAPAIGACICAFTMGHLPSPRNAGMRLLLAVAGFGVATIVFGWSTNFWLSLFSLVMVGALDNISVVIRLTMVQVNTPDALRGRVSAVNSVFISSSNELGAFRAGAMGQWLGAVPAVVLGGFAILALVALQARAFPELRKLKSVEVPMASVK